MQSFETLRYELPAPGVARITLARPDQANAQNTQMLYELNDAFDRANQDADVSVIILAADGKHFSAGHDLKDYSGTLGVDYDVVGTWADFAKPGMEGIMGREQELYFQMCQRWRDLAKPTIAQVQGKCIAGGLMLAWVCDLIVASDDARFSDPVLAMGGPGVEYFAHPWEFGFRKAKEMLFLSAEMTAREAQAVGMVSKIFPRDDLAQSTLDIAERIAAKPSFFLKIAKMAVNNAADAQGRDQALRAAFILHELSHSHCYQVFGKAVDPTGISPRVRKTDATGAKPAKD